MSKGFSGLFTGTIGQIIMLGEDYYERIMPNGEKNIDFSKLPGRKGIEVPKRLTDRQMEFLTQEYGIEFAQVYELGPGKGGRGGKYIIYSGNNNSVNVPVTKNTILVNHTHPGGTPYPSNKDLKLMEFLTQMGSPQKTSGIVPVGKKTVKFTKKGLK
ncbi:MAG: hypothetical protein K6F27_00105 [Ruminococcus sp.]|nr:hypothetical protein [Ruminococcus sp.]